jgi:hypothetical protein
MPGLQPLLVNTKHREKQSNKRYNYTWLNGHPALLLSSFAAQLVIIEQMTDEFSLTA